MWRPLLPVLVAAAASSLAASAAAAARCPTDGCPTEHLLLQLGAKQAKRTTLRAASSREEFQQKIHQDDRIAYRKDPPVSAPAECHAYMSVHGCSWTSGRSCPEQQPVGGSGAAVADGSLAYSCCCDQELWKPVCPPPCLLCRTARAGDQCFTDVTWAMTVGIHQHPEWYGNLTELSKFEAFQEYLAGEKPCPRPCDKCHTVAPGDRCFDGVMWAKEHGIYGHPEWYPDLSPHSTFNAFQAHLHHAGFEGCPLPCTIMADAGTFDF